jgi:hypothetical protein
MKNIVCWRKEFFLVGIIVFLMLMVIGCSGSGNNRDPFANNTDDTDKTNQTGIAGLTGITSAVTGIIDALSKQAPTIKSADSTEFTVGLAGTFTVSATGRPTPTFALTGDTLPSGITFDNSTGVLSGTPAAGTNGIYHFTITASNGVSPDATQSFTLTVKSPPTITSANKKLFIINKNGTFTFTATGTPAPTFALTGALPAGVTFDVVTGTLSGIPATGTEGDYQLIITASNGILPNATQNFTLTVSAFLLNENFNGTFPPDGWSVTNDNGGPVVWHRSDVYPTGGALPSGGTGFSALANCDSYFFQTYDTSLITPSFSTVGMISVELKFDYQFFRWSSENLALEYRINGGSWINLENLTVSSILTEDYTVDISVTKGNSDVQLRWRYYNLSGQWDFWVNIDDVKVK